MAAHGPVRRHVLPITCFICIDAPPETLAGVPLSSIQQSSNHNEKII
jgi:hypothetical protein